MPIDIAFVIGCDRYADNEIDDLKFAGYDAEAVSGLMTTFCGVPSENLIFMASSNPAQDSRPTRNNVLRELAQAQRRKIPFRRSTGVVVEDEVWEVEGFEGDRNIGGIDYDQAVYDYAAKRIQELLAHDSQGLSPAELGQLRFESGQIKAKLGSAERVSLLLRDVETTDGMLRDIEIPIDRALFRKLTAALNDRVRTCVQNVLQQVFAGKPDAVMLAGQGSKIFTVREVIDELLPDIPIDARFQENAVATGAGGYTGVLDGRRPQGLLLEAFPWSIGIKCVSAHDDELTYHRRIDTATISGDSLMNNQTGIILPRNISIPIGSTAQVHLTVDDQASLNLMFVEVDLSGKEGNLGSVEIHLGEGPPLLHLMADVDSNRTVFLEISNESAAESQIVQISNFFCRQPPSDKYDCWPGREHRARLRESFRRLPLLQLGA